MDVCHQQTQPHSSQPPPSMMPTHIPALPQSPMVTTTHNSHPPPATTMPHSNMARTTVNTMSPTITSKRVPDRRCGNWTTNKTLFIFFSHTSLGKYSQLLPLHLLLTMKAGATSSLSAMWQPDDEWWHLLLFIIVVSSTRMQPQPPHYDRTRTTTLTMKTMRNDDVCRFQSTGLGEFSQHIPPPQFVINSGTRCHIATLGDVATRQ